MCSFDYHFHRAMEYEDDLVWIMAVYYNLMHAICMIYYWDNESECMNMMDHLMSCFWEDLREFVEKEKMAENKENNKWNTCLEYIMGLEIGSVGIAL